MLVQLQKVPAVLVQQRKVSGHDDVVGPNAAMVRDHGVLFKGPGRRVLMDGQVPGHPRRQLQRVELRLPLKADGARRGKRQRHVVRERGGNAQPLQGRQLRFQRFRLVQRVDVGGLFLKVAGKGSGQLPVTPQGRLIGLPVQAGRVRAEQPLQLSVEEAVLGGELRRRVPGDAAADGIRLDQQAVRPRLGQGIGAQDARQSSADDQNVGLRVALQWRKGRQGGIRPERVHHVHHRY